MAVSSVPQYSQAERRVGISGKENRQSRRPETCQLAWCGNTFGPGALEQLRRLGYDVVRRGMQPDVPYGAIQVGPALQVKTHHPLLIPTTGDAYPAWTFEHFKKVLLST